MMYSQQVLKEERSWMFWLIQFILWSFYFYYDIQFIYPEAKLNSDYTIYLICLTYFGIPLTYLQYNLYKKLWLKWNTNYVMAITVVISSLILANVWFVEISLLDKWLVSMGYSVNKLSFNYYLWEVFTATILLAFWSTVYLSYKLWEDRRLNFELTLKLEETERLKLEVELSSLKAQLNPHFLFNVLNNIYSHSLHQSEATPNIVLKLSDLMSYILYDCGKDVVPIEKEVEFIKNYIELEEIRSEEKIDIELNINVFQNIKVPPLLFVAFLENAFKHGVNSQPKRKLIQIKLVAKENGLQFKIKNTVGTVTKIENKKTAGIGIENVKKRLEILFPHDYSLFVNNKDSEFSVSLIIHSKFSYS